MRATGCALQQALTAEAAAVVKQAVLLAKRRGHAQVTPLHVANTMLESAGGSFRAACLDSHSHPLQCKALELCFNVALNRLPASSSTSPIFRHSHTNNVNPSISNALLAAFKRAQAHQRRGSVEAQQQHTLLAVKIELEQLVISILDDPSVSRVMREARFSSTQVKCKVIEKSVIPSNHHTSPENKTRNKEDNDDDDEVTIVIENLLTMGRKKKSLVLVGECVSNLESTVKALMDRVDKGQVDEHLKDIKFVTIPPLYTFCNLRRDEVEHKIGELKRLVRSVLEKGVGVVLYLGDFKWISDYRVSLDSERRYYCSVEHVIMEIGRLVWGIGELHKFWLMGIADFNTYIKCRNNNNNNNSLENIWGLHPVTIPANTLGFSLVSASHEREDRSVTCNVKLSCCADCLSKFEDEARKVQCNTNGPTLSSLPSWLMDESRRINNHNQNSDTLIKELCKKWNSLCISAHKQPIQKNMLTRTCSAIPDPVWKQDSQSWSPNPIHMQENVNSGNTFSSYSASSSSDNHHTITEMSYAQNFKEFNAENLNILCNMLEKKVACQKEIVPEIAGTILKCRSGMLRRKEQIRENNYNTNDGKQETWLLFKGPDVAQTKEKISKELAKVVFGSYSSFVSIGLTSSSFDEEDHKSYIERFGQAVSENPHRVLFLDELEQVDYYSKKVIKRAIERGRIRNVNGGEFGFCDAIIVLSWESFKSSRSSSTAREDDKSGCVSLDLNVSSTFDDDDVMVEDQDFDESGMFENVDRSIVFKIQDL